MSILDFAGASQATIDWSAEMTTWVDFPYSGSENGSFPFPFNTLGEGITSVVTNGTVMIKSGSTAERPRITKPMLINAYNGPASIGR